jgi:16S rRNA (cytosine1402-N4)-methyltransferase
VAGLHRAARLPRLGGRSINDSLTLRTIYWFSENAGCLPAGFSRVDARNNPMFAHIISSGDFRRGVRSHGLVSMLEVGFAVKKRSVRVTVNGEIAAPTRGQPHIPVLVDQVMHWLAPRAGGIYLDATFGAGGYARAILAPAGTQVIAIDRDRAAIAAGVGLGDAAAGRLTLIEGRFSNLAEICAARGVGQVDGVVMDVGVSSMQLDTAERGFSFRLDGPLDMRMGHDGPSAADVVAHISEADLARVLFILGEERMSRQIARAIVKARASSAITTTKALA